MDNPLTPNKIQRLIHLAEDKSFNLSRRLLLTNDNGNPSLQTQPSIQSMLNKSAINYESSSGILDLERIEAFGESSLGNMSLSKSTAFNPGEMTGRSTGADEINSETMPLGRHSIALDSITNQMDKQTHEVQEIMRHSIASTFSFHSKCDLTAAEASLLIREGALPIKQTTQTIFTDTASLNNSNLSMGSYFKNRCPEFSKILHKTDSPDRSFMPSISEGSTPRQSTSTDKKPTFKLDQTLDSVPVRQPRAIEKVSNSNIKGQNEQQIRLPVINENTVNDPRSTFTYPILKTEKEPYTAQAHDKQAIANQVIEEQRHKQVTLNPNTVTPIASQRFKSATKPTDILIKNLQSSLRLMTEDTEGSVENSLSISKIADYLGKQSNISVTDMLQYNKKKPLNKKLPLSELHMNVQQNESESQVTHLRDTKRTETVSSAGTADTVISIDNLTTSEHVKTIPELIVTRDSIGKHEPVQEDDAKVKQIVRSKSPSSKSQSTLSTVQEIYTSFKSEGSPHSSKDEANASHIPSPNIKYKELDKSVDWHDVLQQKHNKQGFAKEKICEQWAEIVTTPAKGFVGVSCPVLFTVTTLSDSWLTAKLQFDNVPQDELIIEMPRFPLLLSPRKTEQFTLYLTSNIEINKQITFTMYLKDASIDGDIELTGDIEINFKMPTVQAMSCDGINKITFPPIHEKSTIVKSFVLLSECPVDLQFVLSVIEGESVFAIKSVQEIKKNEINKVLMDHQGSVEDVAAKEKSKRKNKQLCRLTSGNAIRVTIAFNAPKLADLQINESTATFSGALNVNLIGINTVLRRVDLYGTVGCVNLLLGIPSDKLYLSSEPTSINVRNNGSITGVWVIKFRSNPNDYNSFPFKINPSKFEIRPGTAITVNMCYTGPEDSVHEASIIFEELSSGNKTALEISGGAEKPKTFPIKTNLNNMSWVRAGRKELSLKNSTNMKVHIRCQVVGDGFSIDLPGMESRGIYCFPFGPGECRSLPIVFTPTTATPYMATLYLVFDKNSDVSRKVRLFGCWCGEVPRWSGLVTYGDTALVRAAARAPLCLTLYNKAATPAFVCATLHFTLQYLSVGSTASLSGARSVVPPRARHVLTVRVDWSRLERAARLSTSTALASLSVLTGAELTRRRILRILKNESTGIIDTSPLPDHLKELVGQFEGENPTIDEQLAGFSETQSSLGELLGGLHELTAQVDLPQELADESAVLVGDETALDHHTLCD